MNYVYDRQIERFLLQITAIFSNFQVEFGREADGSHTLLRVPVKYGDPSRMAAAIIKENSENKLSSVPTMAVYVTDLEYERDRVQNPNFVDKLNIRQRKVNQTTGEVSKFQGNALTIERLMPVPYKLKVNLDIWTSNTKQKLQLLEQILVLFNPELEIQSTDNYLDWTSLSYLHLENVNWSSRTVPVGGEDQIDIATLSFYAPIWLSAPAKVKKLGVIQSIITSFYDANGNFNEGVIDALNIINDRRYITPMGYNLLLLNGVATLLPPNYPVDRGTGSTDVPVNNNDPILWGPLLNQYGELINGVSEIRLKKDNPDNLTEVIGTLVLDTADPSKMHFTVDTDTIPGNTLVAVNAIIDPMKVRPGNGLPAAANGQRYLLVEDISPGSSAWASTTNVDFFANTNDIIQYNGTAWVKVWDSKNISTPEYFTNIRTGIQYKWTGTQWQKSFEGLYPAGTWSIVL